MQSLLEYSLFRSKMNNILSANIILVLFLILLHIDVNFGTLSKSDKKVKKSSKKAEPAKVNLNENQGPSKTNVYEKGMSKIYIDKWWDIQIYLGERMY